MYFNKHQPFMVNAPYYLILSSTKHDGYYINAGYLMEQVSLYLTSKDIGSCFLGATRLSDEIKINPSMEHVITLGFGGSNSKIQRIPNKQKRLAEKDIVTYKEDVSENIREIIEAARLSPSSNNNQPWRFVVYKNRIHIFCKKNLIKLNNSDKLKQIDIGVAIGNMLVAIDEMWLYAELLRLDNVSKKSFKDYEYVITLKLNSSLKDIEQDEEMVEVE